MPFFVGFLCLLRRCIALEFGFVSLGLHCFLRLSSAGLAVALLPECRWAYSASLWNTMSFRFTVFRPQDAVGAHVFWHVKALLGILDNASC